jgi:hypothetical protein
LEPCHALTTIVTGAKQEDVEQFDDRAPAFTPSASFTTKRGKEPTVTAPVVSAKDVGSHIAAKENGSCHHPVDKKRRAPDEPADGQPRQKNQKHDHQTNLPTTSTGTPAKDNRIGKQDYDSIPTASQTVKQMAAYNNPDDNVYRKITFMNDVGMHPDDADRSTMVVRGRQENRLLTTTKRTKGDQTDQVTLHQVSGT